MIDNNTGSYDSDILCVDNICNNIRGWGLATKNISAANSPYTTEKGYVIILADASAGPVTVRLKSCDCYPNPAYVIKKTDATTNPVEIIADAAATVNDGYASYDLLSAGEVFYAVLDPTFSPAGDWRRWDWDSSNLFAARGDILTFDGASAYVLPRGTDGQFLIANGAVPGGLQWVNSGGGGGEANVGQNIGSGIGLYAGKVGVALQFYSLVAGAGITLTPNVGLGIVTVGLSATSGYETLLTSSGTNPATNTLTSEIRIDTSGSGGGYAVATLGTPSPATSGLEKIIMISSVTGSDGYQLNVPSLIGGTKIRFETAGQSVRLMWTALNTWANIGGSGCTILP